MTATVSLRLKPLLLGFLSVLGLDLLGAMRARKDLDLWRAAWKGELLRSDMVVGMFRRSVWASQFCRLAGGARIEILRKVKVRVNASHVL